MCNNGTPCTSSTCYTAVMYRSNLVKYPKSSLNPKKRETISNSNRII